jgi:hypothetical protein
MRATARIPFYQTSRRHTQTDRILMHLKSHIFTTQPPWSPNFIQSSGSPVADESSLHTGHLLHYQTLGVGELLRTREVLVMSLHLSRPW